MQKAQYLFGGFGVEGLPDDERAVHTQRVGASTEAFQLRGHRLLELQQVGGQKHTWQKVSDGLAQARRG